MPLFRKNYLPSQSQQWVREIEQRILSMESSLRSEFVNNRTRDDQLLSSYNRLDKAFQDLAAQQSTLSAQQSALEQVVEDVSDAADAAQAAANDAAAAASTANTAASTANSAISEISTLSSGSIDITNSSISWSTATNDAVVDVTNQTFSLSVSGNSKKVTLIAVCDVDLQEEADNAISRSQFVYLDVYQPGSSTVFETVSIRSGIDFNSAGTGAEVRNYGGGAMVNVANFNLNAGTYTGRVRVRRRTVGTSSQVFTGNLSPIRLVYVISSN